jgi:hypothetical protein
MKTKSSTLPIEQIEIIAVHDLFGGEELLEAFSLKMLETYPSEMQEIKDEQIWSVAGFIRFLDYWIESEFYDLVDPSFVYRSKLWTSAWRIRNAKKEYDNSFYERMDSRDLNYKIEEYRAICKVKELLLKRPGCYVYNEVVFNEKKNPSLFSNVSVVFYDKIIDKKHWEGLFCDYVDDKYNLLLTSEQVIEIIEDYIENNDYDEEDEQIVELTKAADILGRNPSVSVIVKDYYHHPFGDYYDFT